MKDKTLVCCDAIMLLERIENASATLAYFDPPSGNIQNEMGQHQLRSLYLQAACHAKRILNNSGVIVWHALPETATDVRRSLDRVFGLQLFATEIVLKRPARPRVSANRTPTTDHTSLIIYSKTGEFNYAPQIGPVSERTRMFYSQSDTGGPYRLSDITTSVNRPNLQFPWHNYTPPPGRSWRYSLSQMEDLHAEGRILVSASKFPREKVYLSEHPDEELGSVWDDIALPSTERVPGGSPGQQSLTLMKRVVGMVTQAHDLIVDPFCGTGTALIAAEQVGRNWIGADSSLAACKQAVHRLTKHAGCDCQVLTEEDIRSLAVQKTVTELIRALPPPAEATPSDIYELIASSESKTLEFKQTLSVDVNTNEKQSYIEMASLKTIAAFLNSDGGVLLIGVTDSRDPVGIEDEINRYCKGSSDSFLLHFKNLIRTKIGEEFYPFLEYSLVPVDGKPVLRVDCKRSDRPCFIGDDFYVRTNPATDKIAGSTMVKYLLTRFPNLGT